MQILDEYMMGYLGEYYADSSQTFLVALVGIGAEYVHYPCKRDIDYSHEMHGDVEGLFSPCRLDKHLSLNGILSRVASQLYRQYYQEVRAFIQDASRSGALALNGERFAIAALYCLKILCNERSPIPPRNQDFRKQEIRRNRPWVWRKILGPNDKALRRCKTHLWTKWSVVMDSDFRAAHPKLFTGNYDHCQSRVFRWLLQCFRRLLARSAYSKELVDYASCHSFSSRCQDWPYKTKLTKDAITRYIDSCKAVHRDASL
ncbi:hypothetical protein GALMADRAFT_808826 [Galerina marginata CBS 339.88]|uniref:Uncharacterized protein n=1 Tax=Galerina marginata (strain CBS 339.88) TaxID=685588 RepID=A0A067SM95_GALM3|nr:hypothetical protein GALMADRAFT_808826 [Galerina marginata CBS 339.88]